MRKIVLLLASIVSLSVSSAAMSAVTADVVFDVRAKDGKAQLWAEVRMHGIAEGESFDYAFQWTASDVSFTRKNGSTVRLFSDGEFRPSRPAGASTPGGCLCKDSGEKGCWRTRAWRNIETTLGDGTKVRGVGKWSVRIVRVDTGAVLGSGEYTVE